MSILFSANDLSVTLGSAPVLQDVSFSVPESVPLVGVLGANGSGKTTLLRCIAGLVPHKGHCTLHDSPLQQLSAKSLARRVSYIPQQSGIGISLSVREVVLMGFNPRLGVLQVPSPAMHAAAEQALAQVGLADFADRDYLTLSGGEQQLCILARTLVQDADLLLLDEPDSALDLHNRVRMLQTVSALVHSGGKAAFICLHDPALALEFCDTLLLLHGGRLIAQLHPKTNPLPETEQLLAEVFGPVQLLRVTDSAGQPRLVLLPKTN